MKTQYSDLEIRMSKGILQSLASLYPLREFEKEAINMAIQALDETGGKAEEKSFIEACEYQKNSYMDDREGYELEKTIEELCQTSRKRLDEEKEKILQGQYPEWEKVFGTVYNGERRIMGEALRELLD